MTNDTSLESSCALLLESAKKIGIGIGIGIGLKTDSIKNKT